MLALPAVAQEEVGVGLDANPGTVNFGLTEIGSSASSSVDLVPFLPAPDADSNGVGLDVTLPSLSPPFEILSSDCPQGVAGPYEDGCTVQVGFSPTAEGPVGTTVTVPFNVFWVSEAGTNFNEQGSVQFSLTGTGNFTDSDNDGVPDSTDVCPNTPVEESVDSDGCSQSQLDDDDDGVNNAADQCPNTPANEDPDGTGCSPSQLDDDDDGVNNAVDQCPNTPAEETADSTGCSPSQLDDDDDDGDGVANGVDQCPNTPANETADDTGCSDSQRDDDGDGVMNGDDVCPNTPFTEQADGVGCSPSQLDDDRDGVNNTLDQCPNTPQNETADNTGCSPSQLDDDDDGVNNAVDQCPDTPMGEMVDGAGCADSQLTPDEDEDGVEDGMDDCPMTPAGEMVDDAGCGQSQLDDDEDTVSNADDQCPNTPPGETADADGCSESQLDDDLDDDGVNNDMDLCPQTPSGETVDGDGCGPSQLDDDGDGVNNNVDQCPNTAPGATVDNDGCSDAQNDLDGDGVSNDDDNCPNTPAGETVDGDGCSDSQLDTDGDGVSDAEDQCPNTPSGETVGDDGCPVQQMDEDDDGVADGEDQCPETPAGESVDMDGCSDSQLDDDDDGVSNADDLCPMTPAGEMVDANGCAEGELDSDGDGLADNLDLCPNDPSTHPTGCPGNIRNEVIEDKLNEFAGGDPVLEQTSAAIADTCPSGRASPELQRDCDAVVGAAFADETGVDTALQEVTPERATKANASVRQSNRVQNQNIGDRIGALRAGARGASVAGLTATFGNYQASLDDVADLLEPLGIGASEDAEMQDWKDTRWGFFLSGELTKGDRDATARETGFDYETTVLTTGIDYRFSDKFILGGAVSFIDGESDLDTDLGSLDAEGTSISLYGTYYLDNFYLDFAVSQGDAEYDQERAVVYDLGNGPSVNQVFDSDYDGDNSSAFVGVGWDFFQTAWNFSVRASLDYLESDVDAFSETARNNLAGSGWAVALDSQSQEWLTGTLTGTVGYIVQQPWGILAPYIETDIIHEFKNDSRTVNGRFVGDLEGVNMTVVTDSPDTSYYRIRIGATAQMPGGFAAFADYGRMFSFDNWSEYTISAGIRLEF